MFEIWFWATFKEDDMATLTYDSIGQDSLIFTGNFNDQRIQNGQRSRNVQPGIRLTARGRRLVAGLVVVLVAVAVYAVSALFAGIASASTSDVTFTETSIVVVQPGQTLWEIATEIDSSADPRAIIDVIEDLNAMANGEVIQAGSAIVVPVVE
jgi:hypothetical protein